MGWFSKIFGGKSKQKGCPSVPSACITRDEIIVAHACRTGQPVQTSPPDLNQALYSSVNQADEMYRNAKQFNTNLNRNTGIGAQVYVYDGSPLRGIKFGEHIIAQRVTRHIKLQSTLKKMGMWESGGDGVAFSYHGIPFGVVFSEYATRDAVELEMVRTGTYAPGIPEMHVFRADKAAAASMNTDPERYKPANRRPSGLLEMKADSNVSVVGEEDSQEILDAFDDGALVWVRMSTGEIPRGKSTGKQTVVITIDGNRVGWLTELQAAKHLAQIPDKGAIALARIKRGQRSLN